MPQSCSSFVFLAWYRPLSDPIRTFEKLGNVHSFLDKEGKELILLGDTNCYLTERIENQQIENDARHMNEEYDLFNFKQLIQEPTRVISGCKEINKENSVDVCTKPKHKKLKTAGVISALILEKMILMWCKK